MGGAKRYPSTSVRVAMGIAALHPSYEKTVFRSRDIDCPRFACSFALLQSQRAQGRPGARCTRGLACICTQRMRTRAYRFSGNTPAFPAQWLYGLLRALPGERLSCHRRPREASLLLDLTPAPRRPDHTTSPYAQATHVSRSSRVHRISPHVRDDGQRPSSAVRQAELCG
jgi:hypothetical protein